MPALSHVFVIVMENLGYSGAMATPGFAALASRYAYAGEMYATTHPSLPNYLAMTSGGTWGVTSDCVTCYVSAPNLGEQMSAAGVSWGAYMEGLPNSCFLDPYGGVDYASKHDPFRYYDDIRSSTSLCAHIQPLTNLSPLLAGPAAGVPRFTWVTPNLCHDGHDCSPTTAAAWLDGFVPQITASAAWRHGGVLFVVWDEGNGGDDSTVGPGDTVNGCCGGGHILLLVIRPGLQAGFHSATPYDQYSLLATIEDGLGLPLLNAAADAPSLRAFFPAG